MTNQITEQQLQQIVPACKDIAGWSNSFNETLDQEQINTKLRMAAFLAQTAWESQSFNVLIENMNYSAEGLIKTFPKHFASLDIAEQYSHHPNAIGSRVYANRLGNGDEQTGDGYNYRGRVECCR